jgi:hypothetical protein
MNARLAAPRRAAAVLLAALLIVVPACGIEPAPPPPPGDAILIVGADSFGAGFRVARLLDEAAAASGVLGRASFEVVSAPRGAPADVPPLLDQRLSRGPGVRAIVAVLGDLTALRGVDPSRPPIDTGALTDRTPRVDEVLAERAALAAAAAHAGAAFLVATAPLGRPARVETPELLTVADALRRAGPVLDLQAQFGALEDGPLFDNGFDRLDDWGHDALARALLPALLQALPPRDEEERTARLLDRALAAFAQGRADEWHELLPQVEAAAPRGARGAARRAALLSAAQGMQARAADWQAIDPGTETDVPGLALARSLLRQPTGALAPGDEGEQALAAIVEAMVGGRPEASGLAAQIVNSWPERIEAWLALQLASGTAHDWRGPARRAMHLFDRGPVAEGVAGQLLDAWPGSLDALPALVCARRPCVSMLPDGPVLRAARRHAAVGYVEVAAKTLQAADAAQRLPPSWLELLQDWNAPR